LHFEDATVPVGTSPVLGTSSKDVLTGGTGNDYIVGFNGADSIDGGDGNDTLVGGRGNDTLVGGSGVDTVVVVGESGADIIGPYYSIQSIGNGNFVIKDLYPFFQGNDGTDTLIGVEKVEFANGGIEDLTTFPQSSGATIVVSPSGTVQTLRVNDVLDTSDIAQAPLAKGHAPHPESTWTADASMLVGSHPAAGTSHLDLDITSTTG